MLEIKNLTAKADDKNILNGINLKINDGDIHVIMGPNGTGKSTICKILMGSNDYKVSGSIKYNNLELVGALTSDIAKSGLFLLNQSPIAVEGITNAEMLRSALTEKTGKPVNIFAFNKKLEEICKELDLPKSFIHREINVGMSGGERKKNELLHMWTLEPSFIILDEIDSGLDVDALKLCGKSLKKYHDKYNSSILIITHHSEILDYLKPDYVHILKNGEIIKTGDNNLAKNIEKSGFNDINELSEK